MIFDMLDLQVKRDQQTCVHSALVCRAWTEPASRVLWRSRVRWGNRGEWWLGDLCRIILHDEPDSRIRSVNAYVRAWIKWKCSALRRNGAQRQSMLRCGPRIRRLHVDQTFFMRLLSR
ncbi:hypothetical protein L226DRAFT_611371, partial [Lentinus tigrinus ALCF2SS1-7]|uniref:uncharacterized protein n=1 Tax=Lentinus tigrinus ALCF2SS1-7 TaxID=1328758 RepID=UPI001165ECA2